MNNRRLLARFGLLLAFLLAIIVVFPLPLRAQGWNWSADSIDLTGSETSLMLDGDGNLHLSYYQSLGGQLMYGFRPAESSRWFKTGIDRNLGEFESQIAIDSQGNPHICYSPRTLKYAHFNGKRWSIQDIDKGGGLASYTCSIKIDEHDAPRISWYVESGVFLRYAELKDGTWMARTLDNEGLPGKWNSLALDSKGNPHIAYIDFPQGQLRYAAYDGKNWSRLILDAPGRTPTDIAMRGFGASMVIDSHGVPLIAYYDTESLKIARLTEAGWKKDTVEKLPSFGQWAWKQFRATLALDSNQNPHVVFESLKGLEHAWWDGEQWKSQILCAPIGISYFDSSMAIDHNDVIFVSFKDPQDGTLKLFTGRPATAAHETAKTSQ